MLPSSGLLIAGTSAAAGAGAGLNRADGAEGGGGRKGAAVAAGVGGWNVAKSPKSSEAGNDGSACAGPTGAGAKSVACAGPGGSSNDCVEADMRIGWPSNDCVEADVRTGCPGSEEPAGTLMDEFSEDDDVLWVRRVDGLVGERCGEAVPDVLPGVLVRNMDMRSLRMDAPNSVSGAGLRADDVDADRSGRDMDERRDPNGDESVLFGSSARSPSTRSDSLDASRDIPCWPSLTVSSPPGRPYRSDDHVAEGLFVRLLALELGETPRCESLFSGAGNAEDEPGLDWLMTRSIARPIMFFAPMLERTSEPIALDVRL
eukprot:Unigene6600_Nuclearia_a/m.20281 Unigene6600_Nuclearia_a/g.20281  ORF Unigene6600_Nuclearia_a/g.20281 Unigene6600_Nuclearia_a/m.20281 type:complete len:316 (-) Unigene6600_Nuclearia_a:1555-2502(-)